MVDASLAVVSAGNWRCGADSAVAFATLSAAASEEWEVRSTGSQRQSMSDDSKNAATKALVRRPLVLLHGAELNGKEKREDRVMCGYFFTEDRFTP